MTKETLNKCVAAAKTETKAALELVYNTLNNGQQKKLLKEESIKKLFDLYNVDYTE